MMIQKQKNADAVNAYISTKKVIGGNDLVRIIKADVSYTNHKTEKVTILSDVEIIISTDIQFGGYNVSVAALQDVEGCFVSHSTNFNTFTCANEQLIIIGKDTSGNKGDFTLVIS